MTRPWRTLESIATHEGKLELRQRGDDEFLLVIAGRVLMTSSARRSEEALAVLACQRLVGRKSPHLLIGGLGMGYTLRAALDALDGTARITVAELNPAIVQWCRGPLAALTAGAALDRRVLVEIRDVARRIGEASPGSLDAILLDLYEGPNTPHQRAEDPFYGPKALGRAHAALSAGGALAVWSEDADPAFKQRLLAAGFEVSTHRAGRGGRTHIIYLAIKAMPKAKAEAASARRPLPRSPRARK